MKLLHLTKVDNYDRIKEEGLKINQECYASLTETGRIYFTTSIEKLVKAEGEWSNGSFVVVGIKEKYIYGLNLKVDWELNYLEEESPYCFYLEENLDPKFLEFKGILVCGEYIQI